MVHRRGGPGGRALLADPSSNKGVAFTQQERERHGLVGMLPPGVLPLELQARRAWEQLRAQPDDVAKNVYLEQLHDRNEVLYFRLLCDHLPELLPIVYDPTVGEAVKRYSHEYRRPRGVYLSVDRPQDVRPAFRALGLGPDDVDLVVATDGEQLLGIGDWGVGGMQLSVGKLAVYTAAAGIHPGRAVAVMLDVGTGNRRCSATRCTSATGTTGCAGRRTTCSSPLSWRRSASCSRTRCCTGRTSAPATAAGSSSGTATSCAPSTTISRAPARSRWPAS
jgi:malate dehydrogenase (oxaloacetate-decarboxylating)